jgi:hypothetical protein
MNRHTCYCYGCGANIKEQAQTIKDHKRRVAELELQNEVLNSMLRKVKAWRDEGHTRFLITL